MKNGDFEFIIASPVDREKLICEIYHKDEIIAEVSHEGDHLILEIYVPKNKQWWTIPLENFQQALSYAKNLLMV